MQHKLKLKFWSFFLSISLITMLGLSSTVLALDLQTAKSQGLVGELPTGYLGAVKSSATVNALIAQINTKRKTQYQSIAKRNNTSLSVIETLASKKIIKKARRGHFIQSSSGNWIRK